MTDEPKSEAEAQAGDGKVAPPVIDWGTEPVPSHANYVRVVHQRESFVVLFGDVAPHKVRTSHDGRHDVVKLVASLRVTPGWYLSMLAVLNQNWNHFVDSSGEVGADLPRWKAVDAKGEDYPSTADPGDAQPTEDSPAPEEQKDV